MSSAGATPPGSPRPSKWASRMGAAVRRSSTLLSIARPSTPQTDRDSDTNSLRKSISREALASAPRVDTSSPAPAPAPPVPQVTIPTPIAESPAREAEATREVVARSPLVQADAAAPPIVESPKDEFVPPPTIDSTAGNPGAFTDIIDTIPQPSVAKDPFADSNTGPPPPPALEPEPAAEAAPAVSETTAPAEESVPAPRLIDSTAGNPGAFTDELDELPQPTVARDPFAEPIPAVVEEPPAIEEPAPAPEPAPVESTPALEPEPEHVAVTEPEPAPAPEAPDMAHTPSYFDDKPMAESMSGDSPTELTAPEFAAAVEDNIHVRTASPEPESPHEDVAMPVVDVSAVEAVTAVTDEEAHGEAASYYGAGSGMPVAEGHTEPEETRPTNGAAEKAAGGMFGAAVIPPYALGEYSSPDIWGGAEHVQKPDNVWATHDAAPSAEETEQHQYSGYTTALPIAAPIPVRASESMRNREDSVESLPSMPNPHPEEDVDADPFADPPEEISVPVLPAHSEDAHHIVTMPLPPFNDVIPQPINQAPSHSSIGAGMMLMPSAEINERTPLLPVAHNTHTRHHHHPHSHDAPIASTSWPPHGAAEPRHAELGWLAYTLPDVSVYYAHPARRTTTAGELRSPRVLAAVEAWLTTRGDESRDVDVEAWLRVSVGLGKGRRGGRGGKKGAEEDVEVERYWVDHHARTVVKDTEQSRAVGYVRGHIRGHGGHNGKAVAGEQEDQLDLEFRYWSFMEAHPAHNALPHSAKAEAMDVLTWAWTDRLLPSARPVPAPFSQEECQELMTLLRSFKNDENRDDHGIQTRVVARILLRVALWRQTYFRPHKPLPSDAGVALHTLAPRRRSFHRALFDFIISILCLGIPYLFSERARLSSRADHEAGFVRSNSLIVIGACTCLVAAVILSASVTFLSLPGLDNAARTAGMVAVVFAAFAVLATGAAVLRHRTDFGRPVARVGVEGLMVISRRTVALSLPAVFLAYSLIGFMAAIVLYTFRGVPDPRGPERTFGDYMRWVVVGVAGALAGIVTTALIVLRV